MGDQHNTRTTGGKGAWRGILLYITLLLLSWCVLMFVVIPWDTNGSIPQDSRALIEGQRAYAMLARRQRPTLATTIRGLNMVGALYHTQEQEGIGRSVTSGNVSLFFDATGGFLHLEILKNSPGGQGQDAPQHD